MTRRTIERRLRRDLDAVVATATPQRSWDDLVARIDAGITRPPSTEDVTMLETPVRESEIIERSPHRRLLVGAASVAMLVLVVGVTILVGRGDGDVPVVDGSSPLRTAEAAVDALTGSDGEAFMAFFTDDALANNSAFFNDLPLGRLDIPSVRTAFEGSVDAAAVGWRREPLIDRSCEADGDLVECELTYQGYLSGQPELQRLELRVDGDRIVSFRQRVFPTDPEGTQAFLDWGARLDPTPAIEACAGIDWASTECGELWYDLIDQYLAEQGGE
ncbi:MAG: hypothetical protein AAGA99_20125 [Actinomycetota bacterium]